MVGFKTFWITLFTLLFLGACVPQTKQSKCDADEAFNAQLRTCVPVVPGPTEFMKIINPSPSSTLTRFVNDNSQQINFQIGISNPYGLPYTVTWERLYNGVTYSITPDTETTYSVYPVVMSSGVQIGIHAISVKLKDSNNNIVDTHNFEVVIGSTPTPYINTFSPTDNVVSLTPVSPNQPFTTSIKNNNSVVTTFRTEWRVYKNGVEQVAYAFNQPFVSTVPTTTHTSTYSLFNPATIGIGDYTVRAKLVNTATSEISDEQQWLVSVAHPRLSKITGRALRDDVTTPPYTTITTAYNRVSYNSNNTYNFMPATETVPALASQQSDFCITVADDNGAYPTGSGVTINWYLDGTTLIATANTLGDPTKCLSDTLTPANIVFNNVNQYDTTTHSITARAFDITAGNAEYTYTTADMDGTIAGPISWPITVKPQNDKPIVAFGTQVGLTGCAVNALGDTYSGCVVPSDTDFTISLNVAGDDFYFTPYVDANFQYDFILYRNSVPVSASQCTRTLPGDADVPLNDAAGANFQCRFNIRSWDASGPIAVTTGTWTIRATINDTGSPITPATGAVSRTMTWNLTATETQSIGTPVLAHTGATIDEGTALVFNLTVNDTQRDHFNYELLYCKDDALADPTCTNTGSLTGALTSYLRTAGTNPLTIPVSKTLLENFLVNLPLIPCNNTARLGSCSVRFKAFVQDVPFTVAGTDVLSNIVTVPIRNINPAPVFNYALALPNPTTYSAPANALVGNAVSFAVDGAGVITDASAVAEEGLPQHRYQWYTAPTALVVTPTAINNATGVNLVWTPSLMREANLTSENPVSVYLCIEDQPSAVVATPSVAALSICNNVNPWTAMVRDNIVTMQTGGSSLANNGTDFGSEVAVWYNTPVALGGVTASAVYMAMFGNDGNIHVKKALMSSTGQMIPDSNATIVSFSPLSGGAVATDVQNLSITGTANSLYIAYIAASSASPLANHPQVRRIDISGGKFDGVLALSDTLVGHDKKFGFDYDGIDIDLTLCSAGCTTSNNPMANLRDGTPPTITFAPVGTVTGFITITTPKGAEIIPFAVGNVADTICGNCTAADMATSLANVINRNGGFLEGLSAVAVGAVVTIEGSHARDYVDTAGTSVVSPQIGQIMTTGGRWYLPFINSGLPATRADKVSIMSGTVDAHIGLAGGVTTANPAGGFGLDLMPTASRISSSFNGTNLVLGMVTKVGSAGRLYTIDLTSNLVPISMNIQPGRVLTDIQIAASANYVFAVVKTTTNDLWQGVYNSTLVSQREYNFTDLTGVDSVSAGVFNYGDLSSYKLIPNGSEAYMLGSSKEAGAIYQLYLGRIYNNGTNWILSCKDCKMTSFQVQQLSPFVSVNAAPIRIKAAVNDPLFRTSTDGSVLNQGIRNLLFVSYGQWDGATQTDPMAGVMNIEAEQIGALNIHLGTALNGDSGFYRPPFIKN